MFCPECGSANKEGLKFCTQCGGVLQDNQPQIVAGKKSIIGFWKSFTKKQKNISFGVAGLIVVLIVFFIVGSALNDPKQVVSQYFDCLRTSDWEKMYDCMAVDESELINKTSFVNYIKTNQKNSLEVENYEIIDNDAPMPSGSSGFPFGNSSSKQQSSSDLVKTYTISYIEKGTSSKKSMTIQLIRQSGKKLLMFDDYKVSTEGLIVNDYKIIAPKGANVFIDDVKLNNIISDDKTINGMDTYKAPNIFVGTHKLKVTTAITDDFEKDIVAQSGNSFTASDLTVKKSEIDNLSKQTESIIKQMYGSAVAGEDIKFSMPYTKNSNDVKNIESECRSVVSNVKKSDGTGLKSIDLKDFKAKSTQTKMSNSQTYQSSMDFKYDYIKISKDYFSNELTETPSNYSGSGSASVTYTYEDGKWVIKSIDFYNLYY